MNLSTDGHLTGYTSRFTIYLFYRHAALLGLKTCVDAFLIDPKYVFDAADATEARYTHLRTSLVEMVFSTEVHKSHFLYG